MNFKDYYLEVKEDYSNTSELIQDYMLEYDVSHEKYIYEEIEDDSNFKRSFKQDLKEEFMVNHYAKF